MNITLDMKKMNNNNGKKQTRIWFCFQFDGNFFLFIFIFWYPTNRPSLIPNQNQTTINPKNLISFSLALYIYRETLAFDFFLVSLFSYLQIKSTVVFFLLCIIITMFRFILSVLNEWMKLVILLLSISGFVKKKINK